MKATTSVPACIAKQPGTPAAPMTIPANEGPMILAELLPAELSAKAFGSWSRGTSVGTRDCIAGCENACNVPAIGAAMSSNHGAAQPPATITVNVSANAAVPA